MTVNPCTGKPPILPWSSHHERIVAPETLARLQAAKGFVFDMDGTLVLADLRHKGANALPGAVDMVKAVAARGLPFVVFTNGTIKPPAALAHMLSEAGLPVATAQVMTPSTVAADLLVRRGVRKVMMISPEAGHQPLIDSGLEVVNSRERQSVGAVYVAWHRDFTMDDLENATRAIWDGAAFLTGSLNRFFMTAHGRAVGTSRAISAAITSLTQKRPTLTGKPSLLALRDAAKHLGIRPAEMVVVGDDAALEMSMAQKGGALGVLVQSGISGASLCTDLPAGHRPDIHLASVGDLLTLWQGA